VRPTKGSAKARSIYAILRAAKQLRAKTREFTGRTPERNIPGITPRPLSGTHQLPLTSVKLIGMIRGLFC
jgi:hypothetical protein